MVDLEFYLEYYDFLKQEKEMGKKIIAFMSHDNIPEELIAAAGFIPLRLIFAGNDDLMNEGTNYLPTSTCAFALTSIALFSMKPSRLKFLELIDYFIVSNHCVSDICSSEIICKYFNIPRINFYIPYIQSKTGLDYYKLELLEFKKKIEEIRGKPISNEELYASIKKYNKLRKEISKITYINIAGSKKLEIYYKAMLYGPEILDEIDSIIHELSDENSSKIDNVINNKKILLTGCSMFMGDDMVDIIEESGGNIIFFDTWIGDDYFSQYFEDNWLLEQKNRDQIDILVEFFKQNNKTDHCVPNFVENRVSKIEKIIESLKSEHRLKNIGIINHIIKFCDHMSLPKEQMKEKLQEKNYNVLNLERDYSRASHGQLSTRIEAFLEMI